MVNTQQQYQRIPLEIINPHFEKELESTVYLLGSPGSGKTRFMQRLRNETDGTLVIESGIFSLFQKHVNDFVRRRRDAGDTGRITDFFIRDDSDFGYTRDPNFLLPDIDGLNIWNCLMSAVPLDKTLDDYAEENWITQGKGQDGVCRNLPYKGFGAYHYRESLGDRIKSGGKSGFPDWLFIPRDKRYFQFISYPGHHRVDDFSKNQSIPRIPAPSSAIFLVDPEIESYYHDGSLAGSEYMNPALYNCQLHLLDALELESRGIPVHWFLSKTTSEKLEENRGKALAIYNSNNPLYPEQDLSEIARRIPNISGFDSFKSSSVEIIEVLNAVVRN